MDPFKQMKEILSSFSKKGNKRKPCLQLRFKNWKRKPFPKKNVENWPKKELSRLNRKIGEFHRMIIDFALSPGYMADLSRENDNNKFKFSDNFIGTWANFHTIVKEYENYINPKPEELNNYMNMFKSLDRTTDNDSVVNSIYVWEL